MNRVVSSPHTLTATAIDAARRAIQRATRHAVPAVADFCLVHLAHGRTIRCVAGAHSTRPGSRVVAALMRTHRIRRDDPDSTVAQVMRTGRATLRTGIRPDDEEHAKAGSVADLRRRLAPTSALVVPIVHRDAVLGALSLCYSHSGRSHSARHVAPAERLAARIAATLVPDRSFDAALRLRAAARHAGQGPAGRRRVAARD